MPTPQDVMLFVATFADGSQIFQTSDDKSLTGGANCYSDVIAYEKQSKLISFVIRNEETSFGVDLQDGHFEANGIPFFMHRYDHHEKDLTEFRLIWFRTTSHHQHSDGSVSFGVSYNIGWQANDSNGKNVQRVLKTRPMSTIDEEVQRAGISSK